jgi:large subunit ribosomal protein L6
MSRIGKKPITVPAGVEVSVSADNLVVVKGPKGQLQFKFSKLINIIQENNEINITRDSDVKEERALHGTTRAVISNMITGVTEGFTKELEINGVGYRATLKGNVLSLALGKSHTDEVEIPQGITVEVPKNTIVIIKGIDKQLVGEFAANIRGLRAPEPYKGKGIRYKGERIVLKEGKTAKK